jgi:hypothetical protein
MCSNGRSPPVRMGFIYASRSTLLMAHYIQYMPIRLIDEVEMEIPRPAGSALEMIRVRARSRCVATWLHPWKGRIGPITIAQARKLR